MKVMKTSSERVKYHITLEKEMTVINDLDHPNIIKCLGIVLHPLAAILELAPMGNLRSIYLEYLNEDLLIPLRVVHKTLIDVSGGGVSDGGVSEGGVSAGDISDGGIGEGGVSQGDVSEGGIGEGGVN